MAKTSSYYLVTLKKKSVASSLRNVEVRLYADSFEDAIQRASLAVTNPSTYILGDVWENGQMIITTQKEKE